jgi:hypothetical protein
MVIAFLDILTTLAFPDFNPVKERVEVNEWPDSIKIVLNGTALTSINNGSAYKMRWSNTGNQWVTTGGAPIFTIEVRSIFLGRSDKKAKRRGHKKIAEEILGQEVGELLAVIQLKNSVRGSGSSLNQQVKAHKTSLILLI